MEESPKDNIHPAVKKYPIIQTIKEKLRDNEEISKDQIKGYNRRVLSSPLLEVHVQIIAMYHRHKERMRIERNEYRDENKHLKICSKNNYDKYVRAEQRCIDEFGKKSYEYQKIFGL